MGAWSIHLGRDYGFPDPPAGTARLYEDDEYIGTIEIRAALRICQRMNEPQPKSTSTL